MLKKIGLTLAALVVVLLGSAAILVATYRPAQRPALATAVARGPQQIERGRYLAQNVLGCFDCHSQRDYTRFGAPPVEPLGAGGECLGREQGFPGRLCGPNLTPDTETGLGAWSDGEILRAIREGVDRQGRELFPMMPYGEYRALSDADGAAVVAYLRTLAPVRRAKEPRQLAFPVSFFIKLAPKPLDGPVADPDPADAIARGRYLATVGGCRSCHTPVDARRRPLPGMEFAGGHQFEGPFGLVRSANLTPHATGLGGRTREDFIGRFRAYADPAALAALPQGRNTVMPWPGLSRASDDDLGAIYDFLQTVPAVENAVDRFPAAAAR